MKIQKSRGIKKAKKLTKKFTSGLLTMVFMLTMVLGSVPFAASVATATDDDATAGAAATATVTLSDVGNHWAAATINEFVSQGIINGYPDGTFRPDNPITRAEFITVINKAFGYTEKADIDYSDVSATDWFAEDIAKAKAAGYIKGYDDGTMQPNAKISRQEAFAIIVRILNLDASTYDADLLNGFTDSSKIASWSRNYVSAALKDGIVAGYPDQTFRPTNPISRAEAVYVIKNAKAKAPDPGTIPDAATYDKAGTYGPSDDAEIQNILGNVSISADGVTLQNTVIEGNLTITEAVGEGDVTLKNVTVKGTTYIYGGGENTIEIIDSELGPVVVNKGNNRIRIVLIGDTTVGDVEMRSGGTLEEQDLTDDGYDVVYIYAPPGTTITLNGHFDTVEVMTTGLTINVPMGSSVNNLIMHQTGTITGNGDVGELTADANGIRYEKRPDKITIKPDVYVPPALIGGSGGGGGGGSSVQAPTVSSPKIMSGTTTVNGVFSGKTITFTVLPGAIYDNASVTLSKDAEVTVKNAAGDILADAVLVEEGTLTVTPALQDLFQRYASRSGASLIAKSPLTVELKSVTGSSKTTYTVKFVD